MLNMCIGRPDGEAARRGAPGCQRQGRQHMRWRGGLQEVIPDHHAILVYVAGARADDEELL
jgi:hypothetical protein